MSRFNQIKLTNTLIATSISFLLAAQSALGSDTRPGQGYERDFDNHRRGTPCEEIFTNHPYIDGRQFRVVKQFVADGSYYASRYHNRYPEMSSGRLYHECDATVIAFNGLPKGTVVRVINPENGKSQIAVIQDRGGPEVDTRPDLSRGLMETLGGAPADEIRLLENLIYEVLEPI